MDAIKIGNLNDPHERERLVMAVAQNICCEGGCSRGGIGCIASAFRGEAIRQLSAAPIIYGDQA